VRLPLGLKSKYRNWLAAGASRNAASLSACEAQRARVSWHDRRDTTTHSNAIDISDLRADTMAHKDEFAEDIQILKLRSYQAEVLGKCLEKNVIIASPTGSEERLLG
jgi:hypothetical protein